MEFNHIDILIVEDEMIATEYLKRMLFSFGVNKVHTAKDADRAFQIIESVPIDLVFMDINIKGKLNGIECAELIEQKTQSPIIFTTAHKDKKTIEKASNTNIYGYLIKPFTEDELFASLNIVNKTINQLQNQQAGADTTITIHGYELYPHDRVVHDGDIIISLTQNEERIVSTLIDNINYNLSYEQMIEEIWDGKQVSTSTIRDAMSRLKRKLPKLKLENISGYGYILKK